MRGEREGEKRERQKTTMLFLRDMALWLWRRAVRVEVHEILAVIFLVHFHDVRVLTHTLSSVLVPPTSLG